MQQTNMVNVSYFAANQQVWDLTLVKPGIRAGIDDNECLAMMRDQLLFEVNQ
jgi:hypothetical protein